jgi:[acyl-carrier-protein] S-malonyltransferase
MLADPQATAFLFPGQGSQMVGMGYSLATSNSQAAKVFAEADQLLGYQLSSICWDGPIKKLNHTIHTQPAILTHSIAALRLFKAKFPEYQPAFAAGHSVGEYSALVAAGALSFPQALRLVRARADAMNEASKRQPGGMAAILGLGLDEVDAICKTRIPGTDGEVWIANDNCPGQVVIAGDRDAITHAGKYMAANGAHKVIPLAVSVASHCPLMATAKVDLEKTLDLVEISNPQVPVMGNTSALPLRNVRDVRTELSTQLTSRVRWTETIQYMINAGIRTFVEFGPGNVLTKLLRRIDRSVTGIALGDASSFVSLTEA